MTRVGAYPRLSVRPEPGHLSQPQCKEDTALHGARFPAFTHGKVRTPAHGRPASTGGRGEFS
jgi:hypothetical protein